MILAGLLLPVLFPQGLAPNPSFDGVPNTAQPSHWRYTFEDPGPGWAEPGFDDAAWKIGEAPFGAPGTIGVEPRTEWTGEEIWLRRVYQVEDADRTVGVFTFFHDDDLRIWWNGVEAVRAEGWHFEKQEKLGRPEAMATSEEGRNVLAAHCQNHAGGQGVDIQLRLVKDWSVTKLAGHAGSVACDAAPAVVGIARPAWLLGYETLVPSGVMAGDAVALVVNGEGGADWMPAHVVAVRATSQGFLAVSEVWTEEGIWQIQDHIRGSGPVSPWRGREGGEWELPAHLQCTRRWSWRSAMTSPPVVLGVRLRSDARLDEPWEEDQAIATGFHSPDVLIPGVLYQGNPAGLAALESGWHGLVPQWSGAEGDRLLVEEHRLPAPFVAMEWDPWPNEPDRGRKGIALHSLPSPVPFAGRGDLWWSIGAQADEAGTDLLLMSGPVSLNGQDGVVKSGQGTATPYPDTFLRVPPGGTVEKSFWLQAYDVQEPGSGFQHALREAIALHGPFPSAGMPVVEDIVRAKLRFAKSRWRGDSPQPGFAMYPHDRDLYVMGWAGQSEAPGYALQVLADRLGEPELRTVAHRTLDALAQSPYDAGGFRLALNGRTGEWSRQDPVSQGQAMSTFARGIRVGREQGADTAKWEDFLRQACEVYAGRFLARAWDESDRPRSTAEAFLINPLCLGAALFDEPRYLEAATLAGEHYWQRHRSMEEPYWGGTLDAQCEDKEGAWAAFEAFLALHHATDDPKWLDAATHAAEVCLTYTYLWDVDLPPGRLRDHDLKTRGWTSVSVQNMHLDVFGVVYTPELWRLGQLTNRPELIELAELMFRSCGQMIDADGSQGEQLQQTRFAQGGDLSDPDTFRGGYVEGWTVFWITAHFLTAAAQFEEMGVLEQLWRKP